MVSLAVLQRVKSYPAVRGWAYCLDGGLHLGITNRTNCKIDFLSARGPKFQMPVDSGFANFSDQEPEPEQLVEFLCEVYDKMSEEGKSPGRRDFVTIAGRGDPLLRIDEVIETIDLFKVARNSVPFRVKTFGLVDPAVAQRLIEAMPPAQVDSSRETRLAEISVCLPSHNPLQYAELVGPVGNRGFNDVMNLLVNLCEAGVAVECYTVARPGVDVNAIQQLAVSLGVIRFHSVPYFG